MKTSIKKIIEDLFIVQEFLFLFSGIIASYNGLFSMLFIILQILDIIQITLCIFLIKRNGKIKFDKCIFLLFCFLFFNLFSSLYSECGLYYEVYRFRKIVSCFVCYYITRIYLSDKIKNKIIEMFIWALYLSVPLVIYQRFSMNLHPDYCNGVFGFNEFYNHEMGAFCISLSIVALSMFFSDKWSYKKSVVILIASSIICAISEIKMYFIILIAVFILMIVIMSKDLKKTLQVFFAFGLTLFVGYYLLMKYFPQNVKMLTNLNVIIDYDRYGSRNTAGRLNSLRYVTRYEFDYSLLKCIFGSGLGSYKNGVGTYVYDLGICYMDTGYLGLVLYGLFLYQNVKMAIRVRKIMPVNYVMTILMVFMMVISFFCWNATFTRAGYCCFFILGLFNSIQFEKEVEIYDKDRYRTSGL